MQVIDTKAFRTKTLYIERQNPMVKNFWGIGMDVGFSSNKIFSPNVVACFPSYARKIDKNQDFLGKADKKNILYKDENDDLWLVGLYAQNMISANETSSSVEGLFTKNRFSSPMFKVISRVGLALGMMTNKFGDPKGKTLAVQTGLPPLHMREYKQDLIDVLAGYHEFKIKIGEGDWQDVRYNLPVQNISVMPQPMGALISASTDRNGGMMPDANRFLTSTGLVLDPGFFTVDTFNIEERKIKGNKTWENLGMNRILQETCDDIYNTFGAEYTVPAIQKCLERGTVRVINRKERRTSDEPFADILEQNCKAICAETLRILDETYDGLGYHDYMILSGGLNNIWYKQIVEYYKGLKDTLKIVQASQNDSLDGIFSNVRGYYFQLLNDLKQMNLS